MDAASVEQEVSGSLIQENACCEAMMEDSSDHVEVDEEQHGHKFNFFFCSEAEDDPDVMTHEELTAIDTENEESLRNKELHKAIPPQELPIPGYAPDANTVFKDAGSEYSGNGERWHAFDGIPDIPETPPSISTEPNKIAPSYFPDAKTVFKDENKRAGRSSDPEMWHQHSSTDDVEVEEKEA